MKPVPTTFRCIVISLCSLGLIYVFSACAPLPPPITPEEKVGIASEYPGDRGIDTDSRVVFYENFEDRSLDDIVSRWGNAKHVDNMALSESIPPASSGRYSLNIVNNGQMYTHFEGVDTLFARFYVKFHEKTGYTHHFVTFFADANPTPWPKGGAGRAPAGDQMFSVTIEPHGLRGRVDPPGIWTFYNYWHEMQGGWGNYFYDSFDPIEPGRWYCVEVMIKANSSPELSDGIQAFWIDGQLKGHFTDFNWRTTSDLKINTIWLLYYVTERNMQRNRDYWRDERVMEIWFDDIVLATQIGRAHV